MEDLIKRENGVIKMKNLGYIKRTSMDAFKSQARGGKSVKCYKKTEKTGNIGGIKAMDDDREIMLINAEEIIIRMKYEDISVYGRITSRVKLIKLPENDIVKYFK